MFFPGGAGTFYAPPSKNPRASFLDGKIVTQMIGKTALRSASDRSFYSCDVDFNESKSSLCSTSHTASQGALGDRLLSFKRGKRRSR